MDAPLLLWASDGAGFIAAGWLIWMALHRPADASRRAKALMERLPAAPTRTAARGTAAGAARLRLVQRLKLLRAHEMRAMVDRLSQAGWRSREAAAFYVILRATLPPGLSALFMGFCWLRGADSLGALLCAVGGGVLLGGFGPPVILQNLVSRRRATLQRAIPDALDLLVICAEAGLALDAAFTRVAEEIKPTAPELADEIALTVVELSFLHDRREALQNFARRCDMPSIRAIVNTLIQTERYGTPLAAALRVLAKEYRDQRLMAAEAKAARLPALLTVPMITFILPPLFIILIGPALIQVMHNFNHG